MIIYVISFFALLALYAIINISRKEKKRNKEIDERISRKVMERIRQPKKKEKIEAGYNFAAEIGCQVLGTFFEEDEKYCVICPVIDHKVVGLPVIGRVNDGIIVFGGERTKEMMEKGRVIYQGFKKTNGDDFLDLGR